MKKLAICLYGDKNLTCNFDELKLQFKEKFSAWHITFFVHETNEIDDIGIFDALWKSCMQKRNFEIQRYLEFDVCIAFNFNKPQLLEKLYIVEELKPNRIYSVTGSFTKKAYVTGIGTDAFYSTSYPFDRACELSLNLPNINTDRMRGSGQIDILPEHLFYFHLKSLMLFTECINYEDSSMFKWPA